MRNVSGTRTIKNELVKKALAWKPKQGPQEKEWKREEIELFVLWIQGLLNTSQVRHALELKGGTNSIHGLVSPAIRQGVAKGWVVIDINKEDEKK